MSKFAARLLAGMVISILSLTFSPPAIAKIELSNTLVKIEIDKEFELGITLSNLTDPIHFLSIALHKSSGDPYFGQTKNGDSWIEADDGNCKNFPQVTITEGSWSGKLKGKINYNEKDFDNSLGNYILKVIKYTDSCNKSASDDLSVELFDPDPPPTAVPTNIPTSIPSSTGIPSSTSKPQASITKYTSPTVKLTALSKSVGTTTAGTVLGDTSAPGITNAPTKEELVADTRKKTLPVFALIFISGLVLIGAAVAVSIRQIKKTKQENN